MGFYCPGLSGLLYCSGYLPGEFTVHLRIEIGPAYWKAPSSPCVLAKVHDQ